MGTADHPIPDLIEKVNDGHYHVMRFSRDGANTTLQVDDNPVQKKIPEGSYS